MKTPKVLFLICTVLLTNCYSTKKLSRKSKYLPSEFSKFGINGYYNNKLGDSIGSQLWTILKENYRFEWDTLKTENTIVKLELTDNEKLNVSLINEDKVLDKFYLNGKIKGNYFSIDKNLTFIPLFPIYYIHKESKTILGNDNNGNLILVHGFIGEGYILIMGTGSRRITSKKYKRVNNLRYKRRL